LYECGQVGILTLDTTGQIQDGNPALRTLSGYDEEDLSSMEYVKLFEQGDQAEVLEEIRQLSEGTSAIRTDTRNLRTKEGSTRTVSTLSVLVRDGSGEPNHIFIILEGG